MDKQIDVRTQISMPAKLYLALTKAAQKAKRSPEAEIVERVQKSFGVSSDSTTTLDDMHADVAALRDSVDQLTKRGSSNRALVHSLALAVVSTIDLVRRHEAHEGQSTVNNALASLRSIAEGILRTEDGFHKHAADDWHAE